MFTNLAALENGLADINNSPKEIGTIELIVIRPQVDEREVVEHAELSPEQGVTGDNWRNRRNKKAVDGLPLPDTQVNLMNSRCIALIASAKDRWPLAGDQFYVDLDLSEENVPPGTVLQLGTARLEVTREPHLGCKKFMDRFGKDAVTFVNSDEGRRLHLRGINARVIVAGVVKTGDKIKKLGLSVDAADE